jgi:hypothetical protein
MSIVAFYAFRYWWVKRQCLRAIGYAGHLSEQHVYKCQEAFITIERAVLIPEQKHHLKQTVRRCLKRHEDYFTEGYYKDFDYNKMWLDPYKWTLKQLFPTLTNMKPLEVSYE